jgi:8-oxo-dGTP diphosphatase
MPLPKTPALTVDGVIFDREGRVLLVRRKNEPFAGSFALPGGFVEIGETVETACRREVREEVGVEMGDLTLVGVYSDPKRDPRGHTVSIAYATVLPDAATPHAGSDAASAEWVKEWRTLALAFDHSRIVADAEAMLRRPRRD